MTDLEFSYETCGFLNTYSEAARTEELGGRALRVAVSAYAPWVVTQKNPLGYVENDGRFG